MARTFLDGRLAQGRNSMLYRIGFCALFVVPILVIVILNYQKISRDSLAAIYGRKQALSLLTATIVHEKLDNLVNIGTACASRKELVEAAGNGNWSGAIGQLSDVRDRFPFVDRIVLFDTSATIRADMPHAAPSVIGQSRKDKGWYRELAKGWNPIVSGIYKKGAEPRRNIVSVNVPVESGLVLGILQLQINLDIFSIWMKEGGIGESGFFYVVDMDGHVVYHPKLPFKDQIIDFSGVPTVAKLVQGVGGVELNYNPVEKEERISAFAPVPDYGWGVVVTQPSRVVFKERDQSLARILFISAIVIILSISLSLFALRTMLTNAKLRKALDEVRVLRGIIPICAWCKKIRDDKGYWGQIESYISSHTEAEFSHGMCPECAKAYREKHLKKAP
jgi:hypothetical protein